MTNEEEFEALFSLSSGLYGELRVRKNKTMLRHLAIFVEDRTTLSSVMVYYASCNKIGEEMEGGWLYEGPWQEDIHEEVEKQRLLLLSEENDKEERTERVLNAYREKHND